MLYFCHRGKRLTTVWPEEMGERLIKVGHASEVAAGICFMAHVPRTHPMPEGNRHLFKRDDEGNYIPGGFQYEQAPC